VSPHLLGGIRTAFWSSVVGIFWGTHAQDPGRAVWRGNRTGVRRAGRVDRGRPSPFAGAARPVDCGRRRLQSVEPGQALACGQLRSLRQADRSFRQLNSGVERLVSWQVQYENQLEALIKQETATRESMTEAALRFTDIVNTASEFAAVARSLQNIVRALNNQSEQLARALMLLSGLITEVTEGLPIIEQRIGQLIAGSEQGIRPNQETLGAVSRYPAESIQATGA
jgi:hypothetical protein